ncbi:MAG: GvpL/GvpF family gas vesicle protein [Bacteroidota bacterium]
MNNDLIYVYCIAKCPFSIKTGFGSLFLESLKFDDFAVVIKYLSQCDFSEENRKKNLPDRSWIEINSSEHTRVISRIMESVTVIPFQSGAIFHTSDSLGKYIRENSEMLDENFRQIEGKKEWSVKVYFDRKAMCDRIDELSSEASALEKQIMASMPFKAFLLKRQKDVLVESEIDRLGKLRGQEYYEEFRKLSESALPSNLLPKEFTGKTETMILNAAFLVRKDKSADFEAAAHILGTRDGNSGFTFDVTGPWPPFSFVPVYGEEHQ